MKQLIIGLTLSFALLTGALVVPLAFLSPVVAAPPAAPPIYSFGGESITAVATYTAGAQWSDYDYADVFMTIDQGETNTTTLTIQVSADNSTFASHKTESALITDNTTDVTTYTVVTVNGAYWRIIATPTNTELVTPTIKVVLR